MPRLSILSTRQEIDLTISYPFPPIPIRNYDYAAYDANNYDMTDIDGETMQPYTTDPCGHGATEIEAINSLFDQLEERA